MLNYLKKNKFNICVIITYALTTLIIIIFHENYRDEAQNWLIAKNLNVIGIFKQMKYEGHPMLWYLILHPFARLGFPYITENLISWIIMNITVWILLKKAPFDNYIKILIILTAPILYWYPVIARSYCLIALAMVLIAVTYKNRKQEPVKYVLSIALLTYTHVVMLGLVGMLYLFFFTEELIIKFKQKTRKEKEKILLSLLLAVLSIVILVLQLFGSIDTNKDVHYKFSIDKSIFSSIKNALLFDSFLLFGEEFKKILLIVLVILLVYEFIRNPKNAIIITISMLFQLFVQIYIYVTSEQRVGTILLIIVLFAWIQLENNEKNKYKTTIFALIVISIVFLMNIITSVKTIYKEFKCVYSPAKETAEFLKNNTDYKNATFVASNIPYSTAIVPYINKEFYSPQLQRYFSYSIWDEKNQEQNRVKISKIIENINNDFPEKDNMYFIFCFNWSEESLNRFVEKTNSVKIFESKDNAIRGEEKYIVYKLYSN